MRLEHIYLYKTPLDPDYKNVLSWDTFNNVKFDATFEHEDFIDSSVTKSINIDKNIQLSLKISLFYSLDPRKSYNYLAFVGPTGLDRVYYFITSINYNDSLQQYVLNLKYDDFANNKFSMNGRYCFFEKGHLSPLVRHGNKYCKTKYKTKEESIKKVKGTSLLESKMVVWLRFILSDIKPLSTSVDATPIPSISPCCALYFPFCVIKNNGSKVTIDETVTRWRGGDSSGTLPYFSQEIVEDVFEALNSSIIDVSLTTCFAQSLFFTISGDKIEFLTVSEKHHFGAVVFQNYGVGVVAVYPSVDDIPDVGFSFSPHDYNLYDDSSFNYELTNEFKINNLVCSEDCLYSYYILAGADTVKLDFDKSILDCQITAKISNRLATELIVDYKSSSGNVIPLFKRQYLIKNDYPVPYSVSSLSQWYRNNKWSFKTSLISSLSNLNSSYSSAIESTAKGVSSVLDVAAMANQGYMPSESGADSLPFVDAPTILLCDYDLSDENLALFDDIYQNGATFNVFVKYVQAMSTYNHVQCSKTYLEDIIDLQARNEIEKALKNGVTFWNFLENKGMYEKQYRTFNKDMVNYIKSEE